MNIKNISAIDIKYHFKKNSGIYFAFFLFLVIGIIFGVLIVCGGDNYVKLLTTDSKVLYSYINGTASLSNIFWKKLIYFTVPLLLIFLVSLNYYISHISYILVSYQTALFVMSSYALISVYGFSGVLNLIFIMLPINLIYLAILVNFSVVCYARSREGHLTKDFTYGLSDREFWVKLGVCLFASFVITIIATMIYPLFLKNAIFIVY